MLSFLEYLKESKWNKSNVLWHATYGDFDPKNISPGSHLGTLKAAKARAASQRMRAMASDEDVPDSKIRLHAYRYKGNMKSSREVKDQGDERSIKRKNNEASVRYKNNVEDKGSTSHVVWDTENLEPIHTFKNPKAIRRGSALKLNSEPPKKKSWW